MQVCIPLPTLYIGNAGPSGPSFPEILIQQGFQQGQGWSLPESLVPAPCLPSCTEKYFLPILAFHSEILNFRSETIKHAVNSVCGN